MDAIIFDFDGVLVDSEPIHLMGFRRVLAEFGLTISDKEYYAEYLGYDDHDCFEAVGRNKGRPFSPQEVTEITAAKTAIVQKTFAESLEPLPGAVRLVKSAGKAEVPLAVCSGALRKEIELAARTIGVLDSFALIVAAEDVERGKPDPQGYSLAIEGLSRIFSRRLSPAKCIAVEDSPAGIDAAKALGMKVLAVTNSYGADTLAAADRTVASLADVELESLEELL